MYNILTILLYYYQDISIKFWQFLEMIKQNYQPINTYYPQTISIFLQLIQQIFINSEYCARYPFHYINVIVISNFVIRLRLVPLGMMVTTRSATCMLECFKKHLRAYLRCYIFHTNYHKMNQALVVSYVSHIVRRTKWDRGMFSCNELYFKYFPLSKVMSLVLYRTNIALKRT